MSKTKDFWRKIGRIFEKENEDEVYYTETAFGSHRLFNIPCDSIRPNSFRARSSFDEDSLIALADSIRRFGIIQPLCVRRIDEDGIYEYELISGERRLRAARIAGLFSVPCVVSEADEQMAAEMAVVENTLRKDLNMFESAHALNRLCEYFELSQGDVARRISMSRGAVADKLRLLELSHEEQRLILELSLSERQAVALLNIKEKEKRIAAIHSISKLGLSDEGCEEYIKKLTQDTVRTKNQPRNSPRNQKRRRRIKNLTN